MFRAAAAPKSACFRSLTLIFLAAAKLALLLVLEALELAEFPLLALTAEDDAAGVFTAGAEDEESALFAAVLAAGAVDVLDAADADTVLVGAAIVLAFEDEPDVLVENVNEPAELLEFSSVFATVGCTPVVVSACATIPPK